MIDGVSSPFMDSLFWENQWLRHELLLIDWLLQYLFHHILFRWNIQLVTCIISVLLQGKMSLIISKYLLHYLSTSRIYIILKFWGKCYVLSMKSKMNLYRVTMSACIRPSLSLVLELSFALLITPRSLMYV